VTPTGSEEFMDDERLDRLIRQTLERSRPVPEPPLDEMWVQIERRAFGATESPHIAPHIAPRTSPHILPWRESRWTISALAAAAALIVGVGLGWYAAPRGPVVTQVATRTGAAAPDATAPDLTHAAAPGSNVFGSSSSTTVMASSAGMQSPALSPPQPITRQTGRASLARVASHMDVGDGVGNETGMGRYLVQTAALLASLPSDRATTESDTAIATRASDLLTQTHLLLDSQAGSDPTLHRLLEDLELVLAQVARLRGPRSGVDLQLIHQALTVHDVLPRVHDATVEASITD
jgi:hypothetical protein